MCGLFGIFPEDAAQTPDNLRLRKSAFSIRYRGPDASHILTEPGLGLAHQRLSLVDTDIRSDQPFTDPTGRYTLAYTGEVYNFRSLRSELEALGLSFRTTSDTEVVLHSLIQWGSNALIRFEGMFGLAFVDRGTRQVLLARDRFGMKPLYWVQGRTKEGPAFLFASEIKAFEPWVTVQPDINSVTAYLMNSGEPDPGQTFYNGIQSLAPGTCLQFDGADKIKISSFFRLNDFFDPDEMIRLDGLPTPEIVDEFADLMHKSLAAHLFAEAPVGAFCSGGVDSSLIAAIAAAQHQNLPLFHANVKGERSEVDAARNLARSLKLELHVTDVDECDFIDMLPRVIRHYERPPSEPANCTPLMMAARLATDSGMKGLISGAGADELFLGNPRFGRKRLNDGYRRLMRRVQAMSGIGSILSTKSAKNLVHDHANPGEPQEISCHHNASPQNPRDHGRKWTLDRMRHPLSELLHLNDTMGMAAGIEVRLPFLDTRIARFSVNLPTRHKLRLSPFAFGNAHPFVRNKWVVEEVANRYVPRNLSPRIKNATQTTVFQRLEVRPEYFRNAHLRDLIGLTRTQMHDVITETAPDLRLRLLLAEVWLRCGLDQQDEGREVARLRDHVIIWPDTYHPDPSIRNKPTSTAVPG